MWSSPSLLPLLLSFFRGPSLLRISLSLSLKVIIELADHFLVTLDGLVMCPPLPFV